MKKYLLLGLALALSAPGFSQAKPVKILFDVTSKDTLTHQSVLRHVSGMAKMYPHATLEVVIYGGALPMVLDGKSPAANAVVTKLAQQKNVSFKICSMAMERYGIDETELLPGVEVVPDAIMEIVTKQGEGWGYIKESHN
jgi:uncharacterized protein